MTNLVRGAVVLSALAVAFISAQTKTDAALVNANDSQPIIENTIADTNFDTDLIFNSSDLADLTLNNSDDDEKKLVKTTGSVKAVGMGASRGAFSATAYCFSGRTAMGHSVRRGLIAADPRVLKLGSKVVITAGAWTGQYLVSDTGGAIKGKKIDIWVPSCSEARKFGRRTVQIYSPQ
ncbi:hypothetical protein BH10ACI2_BH10ACI2_17970 [soil metagenome]